MLIGRSPTDVYYRLLHSMGVWSTTNGKPNFAASSYFVGMEAAKPHQMFRKYRVAGTTESPMDKTKFSDSFVIFQDVEFFADRGSGSGYFSGVDTRSNSNFLQVNFSAATTCTITATTFSLVDQLISYNLDAHTCIRVL